MMLLIILFVLSAVLNLFFIYLLVRKYDEAKLNIVSSEGSNGENIEYFELHKSESYLYWSELGDSVLSIYSSVIRDSTNMYSSSSLSCLIRIRFGRQQTSQSSIKSWFSKTVRSSHSSFSSPQYWHTQLITSSVCIIFSKKLWMPLQTKIILNRNATLG